MKSRSFPYIHLIAAVVCFAAAALLNLYTYFSQSSADKNVSFVGDNLSKALTTAEQDLTVIKSYLQADTVVFARLLGKTRYSSFVLKKDRLVFWSDHTTVTGLDNFSLLGTYSLVESK